MCLYGAERAHSLGGLDMLSPLRMLSGLKGILFSVPLQRGEGNKALPPLDTCSPELALLL